MEDLIKEEEFIVKVPPKVRNIKYFFLLPVPQVIFLYFASTFLSQTTPGLIGATFLLLLPLITAFLMVFANPEHAILPLKKIALSILLLMCSYMLCFQIISIYDLLKNDISITTYKESVLISIIVPVAYLIVSLLLILPIARLRQKRKLLL